MQDAGGQGIRTRLTSLSRNRLVRQNLVQFAGGLVAGLGGFFYHSIAFKRLGRERYGDVAALIALFIVFSTATYIISAVLARYSATLVAAGRMGALRHLVTRSTQLLVIPAALVVVISWLGSGVTADFLQLHERTAVVWLGAAVAGVWLVAIPRGLLQGTQRFLGLAFNQSLEMAVRLGLLVLLLTLGLAVNGAVAAVFLGTVIAYGAGMLALRKTMAVEPEITPMRSMAGFALTATAGTLGVFLLYNLDVLLAKHFLNADAAGVYGALNKIGTIFYFLTLSVSQVLFPRVVEALERDDHPGRLLAASAGIVSLLGVGGLVIFNLFKGVFVTLLFDPRFLAETSNLILLVGLIGLTLSLVNLLVQFFMAAHDNVFIPVLALGVMAMIAAIAWNHGSVAAVVIDVLATTLILLAALTARCVLLLPHLHPARRSA